MSNQYERKLQIEMNNEIHIRRKWGFSDEEIELLGAIGRIDIVREC